MLLNKVKYTSLILRRTLSYCSLLFITLFEPLAISFINNSLTPSIFLPVHEKHKQIVSKKNIYIEKIAPEYVTLMLSRLFLFLLYRSIKGKASSAMKITATLCPGDLNDTNCDIADIAP